jgi:PAS domain S-box-containing protein
MNSTASEPLRVLGQGARGILDEFVDMVQVVSIDGTFLYVNRAWRERLGYAEQDALGMGFLDVIHPDQQAAWKTTFRTVLAGERLENLEMVLVARDGSLVPVDGSVWARQPEGEQGQVCAVFRARPWSEQRVTRMLYRDEQTGLYNGSGLWVRAIPLLDVVAENRSRLGAWLLYLEISNLAGIERRDGEVAATEAVMRVTDVLRRALRVHDVVGRVARESFAALVTLPPRYQPGYVTARVKGAVQLANRQANKSWNVELAMGLVAVEDAKALNEALRLARAQAHHLAGKPT